MNPEKAVMGRGSGDQPFCPAKAFGRALVEACHPAFRLVRRWRNMSADPHILLAQSAPGNFDPPPGDRLFHPAKAVW